MKKLKLNLEYCYGIKALKTEFDFTSENVICIYAPNGLMKTSLSKTFSDLSKNETTKDRIWPDNKTKRIIKNELDQNIKPENIFVIESYNEKYRSDRISTLLANEELREEYEKIYEEINNKVSDLIEQLKPLTGLKDDKEIKEKVSDSFTHHKNKFFQSLYRIKEEVEKESSTPLSQVIYSDIFNEQVEKILQKPSFKNNIKDYIQQYDELLDKSNFFKKGVFTHDNASTIAKNLKENGFFEAEHSVFLRIEGEKKEITSTEDLEQAIEEEKKRILIDKKLKELFEKINKEIIRNKNLRKFRECLEKNKIVLTKLLNLDGLRQDLWKEYFIKSKEKFSNLLDLHNKAEKEIEKITEKAKQEQTKWNQVLNIFNRRFSVPFVVRMGNQEDVILKKEIPIIQFDFLEKSINKNGNTKKPIEEITLINILSEGEKRALYILHIIFEVEARKTLKQETLFVVDDITDSFDYKNKYAIVEYLNEIKENNNFQQIILTHNFDFYRTVSKRLQIKKENIMLADKINNEIIFKNKQNLSPFSEWKNRLSDDRSSLIASIPFIRQLAEYSGDTNSKQSLTSLLHIKEDTKKFKISKLEEIIKNVLKDIGNTKLPEPNTIVKEMIYNQAEKISNNNSEYAELNEKITLSIAIRLKSEEFMIDKINKPDLLQTITHNQTVQLIKKFKKCFPFNEENIRTLEEVNLMTPENIHLNSFMYEPIIDLSAHRLKALYLKICKMQ